MECAEVNGEEDEKEVSEEAGELRAVADMEGVEVEEWANDCWDQPWKSPKGGELGRDPSLRLPWMAGKYSWEEDGEERFLRRV